MVWRRVLIWISCSTILVNATALVAQGSHAAPSTISNASAVLRSTPGVEGHSLSLSYARKAQPVDSNCTDCANSSWDDEINGYYFFSVQFLPGGCSANYPVPLQERNSILGASIGVDYANGESIDELLPNADVATFFDLMSCSKCTAAPWFITKRQCVGADECIEDCAWNGNETDPGVRDALYEAFRCDFELCSEEEAKAAHLLASANDAGGLRRLIRNSEGRLYLTNDAKYLQAIGCKGQVIMNLAMRADLAEAVLAQDRKSVV